jgi:hypothetical protein
MKQFFVTILALVYLTVSSGATVNMHYCMGKLVSWDLAHKQKSKCGNCGMAKQGHKGCCKDEQKIIKIDKEQKTSEPVFQFESAFTDAITPRFEILSIDQVCSIIEDNPTAHAPPGQCASIFIFHCNFRI